MPIGGRDRGIREVDATDDEDHQQIAIVFHPFGFFLENLNLAQCVSGWSEIDSPGRGIVGQCRRQRGRRRWDGSFRSLCCFLLRQLGLRLPLLFQLLLLLGLPGFLGGQFLLPLLFEAFGLLPGLFLLEPIGLALRLGLRLLERLALRLGLRLLERLALRLGLRLLERLLPLQKVEGDVGHGRHTAGSTVVVHAPH